MNIIPSSIPVYPKFVNYYYWGWFVVVDRLLLQIVNYTWKSWPAFHGSIGTHTPYVVCWVAIAIFRIAKPSHFVCTNGDNPCPALKYFNDRRTRFEGMSTGTANKFLWSNPEVFIVIFLILKSITTYHFMYWCKVFKLTYLVPSTAINCRFGGFGDFVSGPHVIDVGGNVFDHHPWLLFQLLLWSHCWAPQSSALALGELFNYYA